MRILLLSHYYWPEVGAPQRRWSTLVDRLMASGHQIVVAAPHPHYPHARRDEFFASNVGRLSHRVRARAWGTWEVGPAGERIIRVPYLHSGDSLSRQVLDQAVASLGAITASLRHLRGDRRPDVVISTTPAVPFLLAGDVVSRALGVPHIAEVRDAWPDLIHELSLVHRAIGRFLPSAVTAHLDNDILPRYLTRVQRRAAAVVVTTQTFAETLRGRGIAAVVVRSGVSQRELGSAAYDTRQQPNADVDDDGDSGNDARTSGGLNLLYVGTVGRSQDLASAIRAALQVPRVRLRIVGDGAQKAALTALAERLDASVEFFPQATGDELAAHWEWADAGLVSLGDLPAHARTVPSKLYLLMARRIPVIGVVAGEAADIIASNGAGVVAPPGDIESIAETMSDWIEAGRIPDESAREWVVANASADVMAREYELLLGQVSR